MPTIEESIDVEVPVRTAYDQWTQFEEFPSFMEGVEEVRQLDDTHMRWRASIGGDTEEWDAEITEQQPDRRVAWRATGGKRNAGLVSFEPLGSDSTRVRVRMEWEDEGLLEEAGSALGFDSRRVQGDLDRFKELIEGVATRPGRGAEKYTARALAESPPG